MQLRKIELEIKKSINPIKTLVTTVQNLFSIKTHETLTVFRE
jgi:hypothetical protein